MSARWRVAPCRRCGSPLVQESTELGSRERLCLWCGELEFVRAPAPARAAAGEEHGVARDGE